MATYFGEVSALCSRAVDEEDLVDPPNFDLKIDEKSSSGSKVDCSLLIFSVGELAKAFTKCYIIPSNAQCLFEVNYSYGTSASESFMYTGGLRVNPKGTLASSAYKANEDIVVCEVSSKIPEEINTALFDLIMGKIQCKEALVFTSSHVSSFKSEASPENPFLKSLCTSTFNATHKLSIPALEQPNILTNFPAAVLSEFEIKKKPAICIISYVDTSALNSSNIQNFEGAFQENFIVKLVPDPESQSKLENIVNAAYAAGSNLYT